jgi:hypothetical protein
VPRHVYAGVRAAQARREKKSRKRKSVDVILGIDFDGTVVVQDGRAYDDIKTPPRLLPGAREALKALKRAGHVLLLYSARANRALIEDPDLDPLVRAGVRRVDMVAWRRSRELNRARYGQMLAFIAAELPGIFDAVDDGHQGKPCVDLFIDDRALKFQNWRGIAQVYGERANVRTTAIRDSA